MNWQRVWLALLVAASVTLLAGASLPQLDSVTAIFGKVARNIVDTGEWITLAHPHRPGWVPDRPPLSIWLTAFSILLMGDTDTALRLWHLLMALALVFVTYRMARMAAGREESLLAALLTLTFQEVFYLSSAPLQDVPLTLFLTLAFHSYLVYRRDGRLRAVVSSAVWLGLAVLSKGIVALPLFAPVVAFDLVMAWRRREPGHWRWMHAALGAAVLLVVAAPWFVAGVMRQGEPFVTTFVSGDNGIARFFRPFLGERSGLRLGYGLKLFAYVPMLMVGMLPWMGLLPGAVGQAWRALHTGPPTLRLAALWAGWVFLSFSLSAGDKVMRYVLPCFPPLGVLAARFLAPALDHPRQLRGAATISLLAGIPLFVGVIWYAGVEDSALLRVYLRLALPGLVVFALALVTFALLIFRGWGRQGVALLAAGAIASYALMSWAVGTHYRRLWPWAEVAVTVNRLYRPGDRVLVRGVGNAGAETDFAAHKIRPRVDAVLDDEDFLRAWAEGGVIGLLSPDAMARMEHRLNATVLLRMPTGWVLVTNR